ncbi:MAG: MogA/MoaB family molybdenum cofactor biosynthesis protein [Chloroflexota bacterium]|nr:MogA/MoaB family molybdenum cofactor biosynthesis protein [Chloroflexota bacterium]
MELQVAILTISDRSSRGERDDLSGPALVERVREEGWEVGQVDIVPDDLLTIQETLAGWADSGKFGVILTTGGTGFTPRDITPEATKAIIERVAPGMAEAMRAESLKITPHAMLSRAVAGIRKQTVIINLPGSPRAALENLEIVLPVLPHAVQLLANDARAEAGHRMDVVEK